MVVCHCRAVNDKAIVAEILSGALDVDEVAARCGAGSRCGGCRPTVEALLAEHCGSEVAVAVRTAA